MVKPGRKAIREMPPEELARRLDDVVAKGEHKQYAKLERMLFQGETKSHINSPKFFSTFLLEMLNQQKF